VKDLAEETGKCAGCDFSFGGKFSTDGINHSIPTCGMLRNVKVAGENLTGKHG